MKERRKKERRISQRRNDERGIIDRRKTDRRFKPKEEKEEKVFEDQVEGRNAVIELLESKKDINKIYVTKGEKNGSIGKIIAMAKEEKVIVVEKDRRQMEEMAQSENFQGVIAIVPPFEYCEVEDILQYAEEREENPFVLILDGIEDTHNLGAIIRTAETAGVHGIIIPKRRAAMVNATVSKVACGAVEYMKIARVNNINESINKLKQAGYTVGILIAPVILVDNWKELYEELIKYLYENLSNEVKKDVFFEIIFMTYSYVHRMINNDAFPNSINLYNQDIMTVRGRGKYCYKKDVKEDGEVFFRDTLGKFFPSNHILYIV